MTSRLELPSTVQPWLLNPSIYILLLENFQVMSSHDLLIPVPPSSWELFYLPLVINWCTFHHFCHDHERTGTCFAASWPSAWLTICLNPERQGSGGPQKAPSGVHGAMLLEPPKADESLTNKTKITLRMHINGILCSIFILCTSTDTYKKKKKKKNLHTFTLSIWVCVWRQQE